MCVCAFTAIGICLANVLCALWFIGPLLPLPLSVIHFLHSANLGWSQWHFIYIILTPGSSWSSIDFYLANSIIIICWGLLCSTIDISETMMMVLSIKMLSFGVVYREKDVRSMLTCGYVGRKGKSTVKIKSTSGSSFSHFRLHTR